MKLRPISKLEAKAAENRLIALLRAMRAGGSEAFHREWEKRLSPAASFRRAEKQ